MGKLEGGNGLHQFQRLLTQALGGSCTFLHQRGILLGGLVHLRNGLADLPDP